MAQPGTCNRGLGWNIALILTVVVVGVAIVLAIVLTGQKGEWDILKELTSENMVLETPEEQIL